MKLSVSIDILFGKWGEIMETEKFLNCMETVKKAGYDGIEFLNWWNVDLDAVAAKKDELGLEVVTIPTKCECMGAESEREAFLENLKKSIEAAHKLGCKSIFTSAGHERMFLSREVFFDNMIETLKEAGKILEGQGVTLLIEPVNVKVDHAGVFPLDAHDAFMMMRVLNDPNIKILFDIYHQQRTDGNILETIGLNIDRIGHLHAAAAPGRNEIEFSEINYRYIVKEVEKMGYDGYLGMEYSPTMDVYTGLVRSKELLQ